MKIVARTIFLTFAVIVFTFRHADIVNRADSVEEDSVF